MSSFVREITLKSFSPDKTIHNSGFHLLSLVPPPSDLHDTPPRTFTDSPCFLPSELRLYSSVYLPLAVLTLLVLLVHKYCYPNRLRNDYSLPSHHFKAEREKLSRQNSSIDGSLTSPTSALPSGLRTPNPNTTSAAFRDVELTTFRASTHGATPIRPSFLPGDSDMMLPLLDGSTVGEDSPFTLSIATPKRIPFESKWAEPDDNHPRASRDESFSRNKHWSWSWTFVFRNRRRRMTLRLPDWAVKPSLVQRRPKTIGLIWWCAVVVPEILIGCGRAMWPALALWTILAWCTMR